MLDIYKHEWAEPLLWKSYKLLIVGGRFSFTKESPRWLWKIFKEAGFDIIIIGVAVVRNKRNVFSIRDHFEAIVETLAPTVLYDYYKFTSLVFPFITEEVYINDILSDEVWDTLIFQWEEGDSHEPDVYFANEPLTGENLDENFMELLRVKVGNPQLRVVIEQNPDQKGD